MFEEVKDLQAKELLLLKELRRICDANNITYFLAYGSLIGAVRHHGFIPWDDDVDVCMNYPDYMKFKEVCKTQLGSDFFLQTDETDPNAGLSYFKLRLNNSTLIIDYLADRDMHHGINIDIYPVYNVPDNGFLRKLQLAASAVYMLFEAGQVPENHGGIMAVGSKFLLKVFRGKARVSLKNKCHRYMAKYENSHTKQKAMLFGNLNVCKHLYPAETFSKAIKMSFEDGEFSVPIGYDTYLSMFYGDYMKMPPKEKQGVKLDHIVKISPDEPYEKFKGVLYCVKSSVGGGVLRALNKFHTHLFQGSVNSIDLAWDCPIGEVCA